jgi:hypothetical protein
MRRPHHEARRPELGEIRAAETLERSREGLGIAGDREAEGVGRALAGRVVMPELVPEERARAAWRSCLARLRAAYQRMRADRSLVARAVTAGSTRDA